VDLKVEHKKNSLMKNILSCDKNPIIAEIKLSSPLRNTSIEHTDVVYIASAMEKGNAVGISILTEPNHFKGSLDNFMLVRKNSSLPLIMKAFIISMCLQRTTQVSGRQHPQMHLGPLTSLRPRPLILLEQRQPRPRNRHGRGVAAKAAAVLLNTDWIILI